MQNNPPLSLLPFLPLHSHPPLPLHLCFFSSFYSSYPSFFSSSPPSSLPNYSFIFVHPLFLPPFLLSLLFPPLLLPFSSSPPPTPLLHSSSPQSLPIIRSTTHQRYPTTRQLNDALMTDPFSLIILLMISGAITFLSY